jgi:hypothetical protein
MKKLLAISNNSEPKVGDIILYIYPPCNCMNVCDCEQEEEYLYISSTSQLEGLGIDLTKGYKAQKVHLYVIDDKAEIKEDDWFTNGIKLLQVGVLLDAYIGLYKIIASTNPSLNLPLISNIEECLELIGQEVKIGFGTSATTKEKVAIVKPITKNN